MTTDYETINQRLIGELKAQRHDRDHPHPSAAARRDRDADDEAGQVAFVDDAGDWRELCDDVDLAAGGADD